ncbi:MAG: helicase-related protein [Candidatus Woesearchaeota archaeon]
MAKLKIKEPTDNPTVDLALDTIEKGKQALVFVNTKRGAEKQAEEIASKLKFNENDPQERDRRERLEQLSESIRKVLSRPTRQCERLSRCAKKGTAFHHAGLAREQKTLIEDAFREGIIRIISATPTLAAGVDLPAFRAIVRDLKRYTMNGLDWIPVLEYEQMSGRCGRPKYDSHGEAIAIAGNEKEKEKIEDVYISGEVEEIHSKLAVEPVLRTYVLSLIASEFVESEKELSDFFSRTFWAYQFEDMEKLDSIMRKMIKLLSDYGFINAEGLADDFVSADSMDKGKLKATPLGKRVAQLYIDPLTAHNIINALKFGGNKMITDFSFMHMVSTCLEMRPLLKVRSKEYDAVSSEIAERESELIVPEPSLYDPDYNDYLNSIKTAMFFNDWCDESDEEELLEKYNIRPGEIRAKIDRADWLLYSAEELARMLKLHRMIKNVIRTRLRLRYGVKEELLPLLRLEGIGRVRARKLYNNRIRDVKDIKTADITALAHLIGRNTAFNVKRQVGQDIDKAKVPERKRKGQVSLKDY